MIITVTREYGSDLFQVTARDSDVDHYSSRMQCPPGTVWDEVGRLIVAEGSRSGSSSAEVTVRYSDGNSMRERARQRSADG